MKVTVTEAPKKTGSPQIVKSDKALKLAELWVNNMSEVADDESAETDINGRPSRLGLGAKAACQSKVGASNDPVEQKLYAKLDAERRKTAKIAVDSSPSARDGVDDDEDSADLDSRTSVFSKRKPSFLLTSSILENKKRS